jgi:hypothetical protein
MQIGPNPPSMDVLTQQSYTMPRGTDACRLIVDTQPYTLLGQAGSFRMDVAFKAPDLSLPFEQQTSTIPSLDLLQIQGNGRLTSWLRPGQEGSVRLIISSSDTTADSVAVSLLTNAGIELPLTTVCTGGNEYAASIPVALASGFVDVIARVKNQAGNGYELTASPAFYYGNTMDNVQYDARLCLSGYRLNNATAAPLKSGDTLNYTLSYYNFGNVSARNIVVSFPTTAHFVPAGSSTFSLDSLGAKDSCRVPLTLVFSGKKQQDDRRSDYAPVITWSSGPTSYLRTHRVLVDFQSTITGVTAAGSGVPGEYALYQNYPNPFNPVTTVRFALPRRMQIRLTVYNTLGQQIGRLVDGDVDAGYHEVKFDGSRLASGVYFYRLTAGSYVETKKLLLLR